MTIRLGDDVDSLKSGAFKKCFWLFIAYVINRVNQNVLNEIKMCTQAWLYAGGDGGSAVAGLALLLSQVQVKRLDSN